MSNDQQGPSDSVKLKPAPPPNYTQSPNIFYDSWLPMINSLAELKVIEIVIRQTFGWHKDSDSLTLDDLERLTGLSRPSVVEGCKKAEAHDILERIPEVTPNGRQSFRYRLKMRAELRLASPPATGKDSLPETIDPGKKSLLDNSKGALPRSGKESLLPKINDLGGKESFKESPPSPPQPAEFCARGSEIHAGGSAYTMDEIEAYASPRKLGDAWVSKAFRDASYADYEIGRALAKSRAIAAQPAPPQGAAFVSPRAVQPPDPNCPVCGGSGRHGAVACPCTYCQRCNGTGMENPDGKGVRRCACLADNQERHAS